jgi:hypothetical protein
MNLSDEDNFFFEGAKRYFEEWKYVNAALKNYDAGVQDGWEQFNERSLFGTTFRFILIQRFYQRT